MARRKPIKPIYFTTEDFRRKISKLQQLGEGLDKMLTEYQPEIRRNEIELLRSYCDPLSVLSDFTPCQIWHEEPENIDKIMRSIRLEQEFIQCQRANRLTAYWSGNPKKYDTYGEGFHPWIEDNDPALSKYPKSLCDCYESIISCYYDCMNIPSRR